MPSICVLQNAEFLRFVVNLSGNDNRSVIAYPATKKDNQKVRLQIAL